MYKINPKQYFINLHDNECNQKYDKILPYSFHLDKVYQQYNYGPFYWLLTDDKEIRATVEAAIWGHDSIEDARLTYNDIREMFGTEVAEVIYLCTEFKGRNRKERKPVQFYTELSENKLAVFVKLCDIIANIKYSLLCNSSMYKKYKEEWPDIKPHIEIHTEYQIMFDYIDKLLTIN